MSGAQEMRAGLGPRIGAALIFLACLAVSIGASFNVSDGALNDVHALTMPAAVASALAYFCAAMLIFWKAPLGYCLGSVGALIVAVSLTRSELGLAPGTTWMLLTADLNSGQAPASLILRVLAVAMAATALSCSAMRLLPAGLGVRGSVLCRRTWPAVAIGITISIIWAVRDATPYFIPVCRVGASADVTVLHVRKRGFHIQQTAVYVSRNQQFYSVTAEHQLFNSRVRRADARGRFPYEQWAVLTRQPPVAWASHSPTARPLLLSWNEERWYVRLSHSHLFMFTGPLPQEIAGFLRHFEQLPVDGRSSWTGRDICLGLRYDPLAELGALTPEERGALLRVQ